MAVNDATEDVLVSLEVIAEERKRAHAEAKDLRAAEESRHAAELRRITEYQRNASRVLVQAIEAAHTRGVPKGEIYERVGMTRTRFGQMKRQILAWDQEE